MSALRVLGIAAAWLLGGAGSTLADPINLRDQPTAMLAAQIIGTDHLLQRCRGSEGWTKAIRRMVRAWELDNRVPELRTAFEASRALEGNAEVLEVLKASLARELDGLSRDPCDNLQAALKMPAASFATVQPELLSRLLAAAPAVRADAPAAPVPPADAAGEDLAAAPQIEAWGLVMVTRMGIGGAIGFDFVPAVLFANGDALMDVAALRDLSGLATHKRAHPRDWSRWRKAGGRYEYQTRKGWKGFYEDIVQDAASPRAPLWGRYRRVTGVGDVAMGGTSAVTAWSGYEFGTDGSVTRTGGAAASASTDAGGSRTDVTSTADRGTRRGTWRIEGFTLAIDYDDGTTERTTIFGPRPEDDGIVWIGGDSYTRRDD